MTLQWSKLKTVNFDTSIKKIEYQDYIQIIHMKVIDKVNWQKNTMKIKEISQLSIVSIANLSSTMRLTDW